MIRQQKLFQGFSLVTSCQGVRAEEVWASDHGEYNDAKSPPSLPPGGPAVPLPSQQPFHSPSPETLSCTCICFLQFQFSSFRAGNHVDFPSGRTKTYSRPGAPCAVIGLMPDLARTPPGQGCHWASDALRSRGKATLLPSFCKAPRAARLSSLWRLFRRYCDGKLGTLMMIASPSLLRQALHPFHVVNNPFTLHFPKWCRFVCLIWIISSSGQRICLYLCW